MDASGFGKGQGESWWALKNLRVVETAGNFLTSRGLCESASEGRWTGWRAERKWIRTRSWLDLVCFIPFRIATCHTPSAVCKLNRAAKAAAAARLVSAQIRRRLIIRLRVSLIIKVKLVAAVANRQACALGHQSVGHAKHAGSPAHRPIRNDDELRTVGLGVGLAWGAKCVCENTRGQDLNLKMSWRRASGYSWGYGQDNWGIAVRFQADTRICIFSKESGEVWGPHSLLVRGYLLGALSSGVKATWAWSWPLIPSSVEIKNERSYTSTPPTICLHVMHTDVIFTFTIT